MRSHLSGMNSARLCGSQVSVHGDFGASDSLPLLRLLSEISKGGAVWLGPTFCGYALVAIIGDNKRVSAYHQPHFNTFRNIIS